MKHPIIYLASKSPRRMEILRDMKISFRVVSSRYHEKKMRSSVPEEIALRHAYGKTLRAQIPMRARFVLGADTIVWSRGRVLGKPRTKKEAVEMLSLLSGRMHEVYSALVLMDVCKNKLFTGYALTKVYFKRLSKKNIENYMQEVYVYDKAGAYAIQEGPKIVRSFSGSYTNVVGLPIELLSSMLKFRIRVANVKRSI